MRADLRDARCVECGARCVPGQTHLAHNGGWIKKVRVQDWHEISIGGYQGWDLVESGGERHPPFVKLVIRNKVDRSSDAVSAEFDGLATGKFYFREWSLDGSVFVGDGEAYNTGWWFQKREDAYEFIKRYGGVAE